MAEPLFITLADFRRMDLFSGEVRVVCASPTRRGVPRQRVRANCKSLEGAEADVMSCRNDGGSAPTSAARAAHPATDADLAKPEANQAGRTPHENQEPEMKKNYQTDREKAEREEQKKIKEEEKARGAEGGAITVWQERAQLNGGAELPVKGFEFVDKVNEHIDLVRTAELLLRGVDEKSARGMLERLFIAKYGRELQFSDENYEAVTTEKLEEEQG